MRDVIDVRKGEAQHLLLPPCEACHVAVGRAAGNELDRGIDPFHELCRLGGDTAIFGRGLRPHLPAPIRVTGLEYSAIDAAPHMLDESAEQAAVHRANLKIAIQYDLSLRHDQRFSVSQIAGTCTRSVAVA